MCSLACVAVQMCSLACVAVLLLRKSLFRTSTIECSEQKWKMCSLACVAVPLLPIGTNVLSKCSETTFFNSQLQLFVAYCAAVPLLPFFFTDKKKFVSCCVSKKIQGWRKDSQSCFWHYPFKAKAFRVPLMVRVALMAQAADQAAP